MSQWEDDLQEVVEERGDGLARFAAVVAGSAEGGREALVVALAQVFRHGSPLTVAARGGEQVAVLTDDVDELVIAPVLRAVVAAQDLPVPVGADGGGTAWHDLSPGVRAALALRADGWGSDDVARSLGVSADDVQESWRAGDTGLEAAGTTTRSVLDAVAPAGTTGITTGLARAAAERVRLGRRRTRRRATLVVASVVGLVTVVAAASFVVPGRGAAHPGAGVRATEASRRPAPTRCGDRPAADPALGSDEGLTVRSSVSTIRSTGTWRGTYALEDGLTSEQHRLLGGAAMSVTVVVTRDGVIVAHGVQTGDESAARDLDGAAGDVPHERTFDPCEDDGWSADDELYDVVAVGSSPDGNHWVVSDPVPLRVLSDQPFGYQPPWLTGSELACGESVDDFEARIADRMQVSLQPARVDVGSSGTRYTYQLLLIEPAQPVRVAAPTRMAVAWVRDGVIVGVGPEERGLGYRTMRSGDVLHLTARWDTTDHCDPEGATHLPAGTYQVLAYARFATPDAPDGPDGNGAWSIVGSGAARVVVAADGSARTG
ncbi:hypothetical protein [Luteimicrobium subarcticum]|uniref:Uncharacterized protein n=1 Tax=Luteimicrobium subarcticum TaxID=620910 RepID=A0A2M8W1G3_9MICO|nr:hypothetical protein [Luteimicrobium subarcticum]PJI84748.1 hypothetical protein CLV34_3204 [Luteimicrobium subarcticum]